MMRALLLLALLAACGHQAAAVVTPEAPAAPASDESACQAGDGPACLRAARAIQAQSPSAESPRARRQYHFMAEACRLEVWDACAEHGALLAEGLSDVPADPAAGIAVLRPACAAGSGMSCGSLGYILWTSGQQAEAESLRQKSLTLLRAACARGDGSSCRGLGLAHAMGAFPAEHQDLKLGGDLLYRACDLGVRSACNLLAMILAQTSDPRALTLVQDTCEQGNAEGCAMLGHYLQQGTFGAADPAAALVAFQRGCELDDAQACVGAAYLDMGAQQLRSIGEMRRACELGEKRACEALR